MLLLVGIIVFLSLLAIRQILKAKSLARGTVRSSAVRSAVLYGGLAAFFFLAAVSPESKPTYTYPKRNIDGEMAAARSERSPASAQIASTSGDSRRMSDEDGARYLWGNGGKPSAPSFSFGPEVLSAKVEDIHVGPNVGTEGGRKFFAKIIVNITTSKVLPDAESVQLADKAREQAAFFSAVGVRLSTESGGGRLDYDWFWIRDGETTVRNRSASEAADKTLASISGKPASTLKGKKAEQWAYKKAKCAHEAMFEAGKVFQDEQPDGTMEQKKEKATRELDEFDRISRDQLQKCFTRDEVYYLGRLSHLTDVTKEDCPIKKTKALGFGRTKNNVDGDILNAAASYEKIGRGEQINDLAFFAGQSSLRGTNADACATIIEEFGPEGSLMPGFVAPN